MASSILLPLLEQTSRPSVADKVFDELHRQILSLDLLPGTKISEVEIAKAMGISRQPVRDAFYRLSKIGFLIIRPQRATTVSKISLHAVLQARFIRTAIELETARVACHALTTADHREMDQLIEQQVAAAAAGERSLFHQLDDQFHREICERSGHPYAWELIRETKAHMDRVRFLSLAFASQSALDDHINIWAAIKARDPDLAVLNMRQHLSRIEELIKRIRAEHAEVFETEMITT